MPVNGWHTTPISTLFESTIPGDWGQSAKAGAGVPVLRSTNFRDDGTLDYGDIAMRDVAPSRLDTRRIMSGTILMEKAGGSSTRAAGRVVYCDRDFGGTASNFVEIIRVHESTWPKFVFYLLFHSFWTGRVYKYQQQTTGIINFKIDQYAHELVSIPAQRTEQAKIAEVLSTVDQAIDETQRTISKQQRIKTGLMQDLLSRGVDENGALRSESTHEFKDARLGRIPSNWDERDFFDTGEWFSGGTPSKANGKFWGGDVPWVCPKDMKQFELAGSIDRITPFAVKSGARLVPPGSVFIVIRGMILAHTFPVGYSTREVAFNQDVKAIVPKPDVNGRYLAYWLSSHSTEFLKLTTTATHGTKRFDMDELYTVPIGMPKPEEQESIVRILDEQQSLIDQTHDQLVKLQSLKRGLMADLLSGERRVTALLAEPEAVTA